MLIRGSEFESIERYCPTCASKVTIEAHDVLVFRKGTNECVGQFTIPVEILNGKTTHQLAGHMTNTVSQVAWHTGIDANLLEVELQVFGQ